MTQLVESLRHMRPTAGKIFRSVGRVACTTARALSSRRFVVCTLLLLIVAELCALGVGVVRKLEVAAERTARAADLYMAATEAQAFGAHLQALAGGAADIGAKSGKQTEEGKTEEPVAGDEAPPLPPRDVLTIVADETGVFLDDDFSQPAQVVRPAAQPEDAAGNALSPEDAQEIDGLIRKAVSAMIAGDMRLCVLCLEQGCSIAPEHPALLYYYGMAFDKLLNPDKARDYYTRVFRLRDKAGKYFERASRRLTYGMAAPSAMRGKLSFGPPLLRHIYDDYSGDQVSLRLPVMLAPGEEVRVEDIRIRLRFFVLVNNRRIEFSSVAPVVQWENDTQTFSNSEENLIVTYNLPVLSSEEQDVYDSRRYYGYTAKLYYRDEPLDCISSPSALILHEQMLDAREAREYMRSGFSSSGLLPDDGLVPEYTHDELPLPTDVDVPTESSEGDEQATPFSRFIEEIDPS